MKTPPFLISAVLLFWGWTTNLLLIALLLIPAIEAARFLPFRWNRTVADFSRVADTCSLIIAGLVVYLLFTHPRDVILVTLKWLPVIVYPLLAVQEYSTAGKLDSRALLMLTRKMEAGPDLPVFQFNATYPYVIICLIAAGSANLQSGIYYAGLLVLTAWGLFPLRSRRYPLSVWIGTLITAAALGYGGLIGIQRLQRKVMNWTSAFFLSETSPGYTSTAIGEIGLVKQSGWIVFRVAGLPRDKEAILLREATYNRYISTSWFAGKSPFRDVESSSRGTVWKVAPFLVKEQSLTISSYTSSGKGLLKLPGGVVQIHTPTGILLQANDLGAISVQNAPGLLTYTAGYGKSTTMERIWDKRDLYVPQSERKAIYQFIDQTGLNNLKNTQAVLDRLKAVFHTHFTYSLDFSRNKSAASPIRHFLLESRSGHCEYFATATVLVLRALDIPARYAKGYLAHEYSPLEKKIIVRARHAHVWALVYTGDQWIDWDTTPPDWRPMEKKAASGWEQIADFLSYITYGFSKWRWDPDTHAGELVGMILLLPLILILIKRVYSRKKAERVRVLSDRSADRPIRHHTETGLYRIEKALHHLGWRRFPWETFPRWIRRIREAAPDLLPDEPIAACLKLHETDRFSMAGLSLKQKQEFDQRIDRILAALNERQP